jgi:hypothetical protein
MDQQPKPTKRKLEFPPLNPAMPNPDAFQDDGDLNSPYTLEDLAKMTDEEARSSIPTPKGYYGGSYGGYFTLN